VSAGGKRTAGGRSRRGGGAPVRRFPRAARINEVLRQVLAEEIERLVDSDERLTLVTVTAVETDRDLRHATLLFSRLGPAEIEALADARVRLQATIARQVRLKWTPLLSFAEDPAVIGGQRVEDILRELRAGAPPAPGGGGHDDGGGRDAGRPGGDADGPPAGGAG
jgi:ribosome-binding factor A